MKISLHDHNVEVKNDKVNILSYLVIIFVCFFPFIVMNDCSCKDEKQNRNEIIAKLLFEYCHHEHIEFINIYKSGKVITCSLDDGFPKKSIHYINEKKKNIFYNKLAKSGIDNNEILEKRFYIGPSASNWKIEVLIDSKYFQLQSWHPVFENKDGLVVTQDGIYALEKNENKTEYFNKNASIEYKKFLRVWNKCFSQFNLLYHELINKPINIAPEVKCSMDMGRP